MTWEVSWSETALWSYYNKKYRKPVVPLPDTTTSGVTIGIGYDCGHMSAATIEKDWRGVLPLHMVESLKKVAGLTKRKAVAALPIVKNVDVPIEAALQVFYNTTIYKYAKVALSIYPNLPNLHPVEQATIVGLVYNRGGSIVGYSRREMRQLIDAIKEDNDKKMADLIRAMIRLWPNIEGLKKRRRAEASLIELPDTPIAEADKLILWV